MAFSIEQMRGRGIEIGAHELPIEGIQPIYVDRFRTFAGAACPADVLADGSALPFHRQSLDYLACSHLLEHLPNPIAGLDEWYRVLKPGALLYMVVPDRRFTFDHKRSRTPLSHLIADFERSTTDIDGTHIDEYFDNVDVARLWPDLAGDGLQTKRSQDRAACHAQVAAGRPINIHFHVFEKEDVLEMVRFCREDRRLRHRWDVLDVREHYPPNRGDGFLVVLRAGRKGLFGR